MNGSRGRPTIVRTHRTQRGTERTQHAAPIYSLGISTSAPASSFSPTERRGRRIPPISARRANRRVIQPIQRLFVSWSSLLSIRRSAGRTSSGAFSAREIPASGSGISLVRACSGAVDSRLGPFGRTVGVAAPARPDRARDNRAHLVGTERRAVEDRREVLPQCALDGARLAPARKSEEQTQEFEVLGTVEAEVEAAVVHLGHPDGPRA